MSPEEEPCGAVRVCWEMNKSHACKNQSRNHWLRGQIGALISPRALSSARPAAVLLAVAWMTLFVIGTDLFVVSPLIPLIGSQFGADAADVGLLVTVFSLGYVISAPILGHFADRFGRRRVLLHCLSAFALANVLTAISVDFHQLLVARLACGLFAGGVTPSIYALVSDAAPPNRRGTWMALAVTGLLSALPLGASAGTWAGSRLGWSIVFVILGTAAAVLVGFNGLAWSASRSEQGYVPGERDVSWRLPLVSALLPTVAWSTALYGMYTYLGAGLVQLGYTAPQVAETVFVYGIAAFAGSLISGFLVDRLGSLPTVRMSFALLCIMFAILGLASRSGQCIGLAIVLTSIVAQTFFPAQQTRLIGAFSTRRATALSWNNCALFLGMTLGSLIGGQVMATGGFAAIPVMSAGLSLAGLLTCSRWLPHLLRGLSAQTKTEPDLA